MIVTTKKYENILECYAFKGLSKELIDRFQANSLDIEYHGNVSKTKNCTMIPMSKQDEYLGQWFTEQFHNNIETYYGYLVIADWEICLEEDLQESVWETMCSNISLDFLYNQQEITHTIGEYGVKLAFAQFPPDNFGDAMDLAKDKNAVLLAGRKSEASIEEFANMFCKKGRFFPLDENEVFRWVDREQGMYIMYTCDNEGELISIFEKRK